MKFVLLVTLLVRGQAPYSFQVEFSSQELCDSARQNIYSSYSSQLGATISSTEIHYSAICLQKNSN
jgi:hypothetical protein